MVSPDSHLRRTALALLAALVTCAALAASAAASAPTLAGESIFGTSPVAMHVDAGSSYCNPDGSGYIAFTASGTASGPFPGPFEEQGYLYLGPRPAPQGGVAIPAPVTGYSSDFTITSGSTTVLGFSQLGEKADMLSFAPSASDFQNQGECLAGPLTANQFGVGIRYSASIIDGALALDDVQAMSNARNLVSQVESCYTDVQDYTGCMTEAQLPNTGLTLGSQPGQVEVTAATANGYTIVGHSLSGVDFTITKAENGTTTRTCVPAGQNGCLSDGHWLEGDRDYGFGYAAGAENRLLSPPTVISGEFATLTGATVPGPPPAVVAAPSDGSAVVSWAEPASDGGNPIRDYVVYTRPYTMLVSACPSPVTHCTNTSVTVPGLTNGVSYTFFVQPRNAVGYSASPESAAVTPAAGTAAPAVAVAVASATSPTTVTTGGAATTAITVPAGTAGGLVSLIQTATSTPPPTGYSFVGSQTNISAPAASVAEPLVLAFTVDRPTLEAAGLTWATVEVLRDGVPITTKCATATQSATPDPCVADRTDNTDGSATITVRSSHASAWNLGRRVFSLSGLFQPVDPRPAVNLAKAGSAIPLKFSLGGDQGLNVLAAGYPKSGPMTCASVDADPIEATVAASQNTLSYDAATDRYTYVWKTDKSWSTAPAGPCRQLVIRFTDGSERRADFRFAK